MLNDIAHLLDDGMRFRRPYRLPSYESRYSTHKFFSRWLRPSNLLQEFVLGPLRSSTGSESDPFAPWNHNTPADPDQISGMGSICSRPWIFLRATAYATA